MKRGKFTALDSGIYHRSAHWLARRWGREVEVSREEGKGGGWERGVGRGREEEGEEKGEGGRRREEVRGRQGGKGGEGREGRERKVAAQKLLLRPVS